MEKGYRIEYHKQGKVIQLTSKCCGAKVYYDYMKIDDFKPPRYIGLRHGAYCLKCHKPTELEEGKSGK